jgi:beta-glucanase (GH16 family)
VLFKEDPMRRGVWRPIASLTDEFEGSTLDTNKWWNRDPRWEGRPPAWFYTNNVVVTNGMLRLLGKAESPPHRPWGFTNFTSAAVKSKEKALYGYFETRCRVMDARMSSAFWLYDLAPVAGIEVDVFEICGGHPDWFRRVFMTSHIWKTPEHGEKHVYWQKFWDAPFHPARGFHVYALHWTPEKLRFLVDGICWHEERNKYWHYPMYVVFDVETQPEWMGLPTAAELPAEFAIDYLRSWERIDPPMNRPVP